MIDGFGISDIGRRRALNEDSLLIDKTVGLYVVADGMGGHNAGDVASRMAVEAVSRFIHRSQADEEISWPLGVDIELSLNTNRLRTGVMLANKRVWKEAESHKDYTGMGTTIVAALAEADVVTLCSAGDSRAYRLRGQELQQITTDDSWTQVATSKGILKSENVENYPMKNILTKALGLRETIELSPSDETMEEGDLYLLCSDGLHGMLSDSGIRDILLGAEDDLKKAVSNLIEAANEEGGKDNITAVVFRYRKPQRGRAERRDENDR